MLILSIPGNPVFWKRGSLNRPDPQKDLKDDLQSIFISERKKQSQETFLRPTIVHINFWLATPENRRHLESKPCYSHGNLQDYAKLILYTCQEAKVFIHERVVYALQISKRYSSNPRTDIEITEVPNEVER